MSRLERKPWTITSGRAKGILQERRRRRTLLEDHDGLPAELIGKANLAVTPANPNRIYALIEALPGGGLNRSDDSGQTWAQVNSQGS
jgi:hypothetical protein